MTRFVIPMDGTYLIRGRVPPMLVGDTYQGSITVNGKPVATVIDNEPSVTMPVEAIVRLVAWDVVEWSGDDSPMNMEVLR